MNILQIKKGEIIAKKQDKVMEWYLIQDGVVSQKFGSFEIALERNSIIGILERDWFLCDYVAKDNTTLIVIECKNPDDLTKLLHEHENFRAVFLRAALEQKYRVLSLFINLSQKSKLLHAKATEFHDKYNELCKQALLETCAFSRMDSFEVCDISHKVEQWEINNCNSLIRKNLKEYLTLMIKDDALCVGAILESASQMRRVTLGISELVAYLDFNKDVFWAQSENDLFHLYIDLIGRMTKQKQDVSEVTAVMKEGFELMNSLGIYTEKEINNCKRYYDNYDVHASNEGRINLASTDCVKHIMEYAGFDEEGIGKFKALLEKYIELPDKSSTESDVYKLRKMITNEFYQIYENTFFKAVQDASFSPIIGMFLNFGFMDMEMVGDEIANGIYNLTDHLSLFQSDHVYTIYDWLKAIYEGRKEPSRNEFDMDYKQNLVDLRRQGELTEADVERLKDDQAEKVKFEIANMFRSGHRMTYGRVTTFCPVLCEVDFINSVEKLAVTVDKLKDSINKVRNMDYSILYREVMFSDTERGITQEWLQKEVIPDIILMPDVGCKGAMWQETSGAKSDTPARFMFPIFMTVDLDDQMVETLARYRWEICRRLQGVYWNDIREKSLTAEYYDYLQFYRKNQDLSTEAKEKVKTSLQRARNNYREVFVKDYINWLKYEAKGSFRLNKVARGILTRYCPFSKEIRKELKSNPVYQNAFNKLEVENSSKLKRFIAVCDKYEAAGGKVTAEFRENINFYQM